MWDIETSALNGSYGHLLCSCHRFTDERKGKVHTIHTDGLDGEKDLLLRLTDLYSQADILVTWNGLNFDRRFVNSRLLLHSLPPLPSRFHIDLLHIHRHHFRTNGHRLDGVLKDLNCTTQKYEVRAEGWQQATDPTHPNYSASLAKLLKHCRHDVLSLEEVFYRLKPYIRRLERR